MGKHLKKKNIENEKIFIIVIPDGAADQLRVDGKSPLEIANTPFLDAITGLSCTGLMKTLYSDLPKDSVVAQLGLLGYDPYVYFPKGRSYFEVPDHVQVSEDDLVFRVNLVFFDKKNILKSYNGFGITSDEALKIVNNINSYAEKSFSEFELYNISEFRNILIIRKVVKKCVYFDFYEPHEEEGQYIDKRSLINSSTNPHLAKRINKYISFVNEYINHPKVNSILPWGYSHAIDLPKFSNNLKGCIIGHMDFLNGFSKKMGLDFQKAGNSNWDSDYKEKGDHVINKINEGYNFIYCHINGPDEASHMNNLEKKIFSIEQIDKYILEPIITYFSEFPDRLGAVAICPDHYTNIRTDQNGTRREAHSIDDVPFAVWNNKKKDMVTCFSENSVKGGGYGPTSLSHLDLLSLMGIKKSF